MDKRIIFLIISFIVLVLGGVVLGVFMYQQEKATGTPKIKVDSYEYDAGTVSMSSGLVKHAYSIKNDGYGDLIINDIETSCMCTKTILKTESGESPEFSMHNEDVSWTGKIVAHEEAELEVIFDPAFHGPKGTGEIVRLVTFNTNDPDRKEIEIKLLANVAE